MNAALLRFCDEDVPQPPPRVKLLLDGVLLLVLPQEEAILLILGSRIPDII